MPYTDSRDLILSLQQNLNINLRYVVTTRNFHSENFLLGKILQKWFLKWFGPLDIPLLGLDSSDMPMSATNNANHVQQSPHSLERDTLQSKTWQTSIQANGISGWEELAQEVQVLASKPGEQIHQVVLDMHFHLMVTRTYIHLHTHLHTHAHTQIKMHE